MATAAFEKLTTFLGQFPELGIRRRAELVIVEHRYVRSSDQTFERI